MVDQLSERIDRAKRQVLADVAAGIVPATVASFSELHDYVDANGYGGAFEDDAPEANDGIWDALQSAVDEWIKSGGVVLQARSQHATGARARAVNQIEGYGVRGLNSKRWRRKFVDEDAMRKSAEKNDAEVHGTRMLEDWERTPRNRR